MRFKVKWEYGLIRKWRGELEVEARDESGAKTAARKAVHAENRRFRKHDIQIKKCQPAVLTEIRE